MEATLTRSDKAKELQEQYLRTFPNVAAPSRVTTDRSGNFVMPTAYRPAKVTYTSQVS